MKYITNLNDSPYFEPINGLRAKLVHTEEQTFAFWEIEKDTVLPEHQHPHKQISFVTRGKLELSIDKKTSVISKGMFAIIPPNTNHSARAITNVELTDVFTPIREDFPTTKIDKR